MDPNRTHISTNDEFLSMLGKYFDHQLSPAEIDAFLDAAGNPAFEALITDRLHLELQQLRSGTDAGEEKEKKVWESIDAAISNRPLARRVHLLRTAWVRYAAAIIILLGVGAYLWNNYQTAQTSNTAAINPSTNTIKPGSDRAILTLANGRQIILDSTGNGQLAIENGTEVVKSGGKIMYNNSEPHSGATTYNTMSTPNGGQYQLTLHDGTKVWLNAASSITYPTSFNGNERKVLVTGEVYFEVARDKTKPFIAEVNEETKVEVLGTSFNLNAYTNEEFIKTTLLEGAVKINDTKLAPGQQAVVANNPSGNQQLTINRNVNINVVMAWKNGYFDFDNTTLPAVMRQLERWYNIQVRYKSQVPDVIFRGQMDRNVQLTDVIRFLQDFGLKAQLDGRTLTIQ